MRLLVCGGADQIWPSCPASLQLEAHLTAARFPFPHRLLAYDDGGHFVSSPANDPYVPDPGGLPVYGSTDQSNPLASADAWPKTVAFLQSR